MAVFVQYSRMGLSLSAIDDLACCDKGIDPGCIEMRLDRLLCDIQSCRQRRLGRMVWGKRQKRDLSLRFGPSLNNFI